MNEFFEKGITTDHIQTIYGFVYRITRKFRFDEHTCMDVTQEIVMKLYMKSGTFAGKSQEKSWIYSVAKNHCINYKKRIYDKNPLPVDFSETVSFTSISNDDEDSFPRKELRDVLYGFIQQLPDQLKNPLVYFYYTNLKYAEISEKMDIPIGTVKSRINTAKNLLRKQIEEYIRRYCDKKN